MPTESLPNAARLNGVDAYVKALRTAERSAAEWLGQCLADDVVLITDGAEIKGKGAILARLGGIQPITPTLFALGVSDPKVDADGAISIEGAMPPIGAAPSAINLMFAFDDDDRVIRIDETIRMGGVPGDPTPTIPINARGYINGALANGTPMVFTYVDGEGIPHTSLRGSIQVYSGTQLSIWLRPTDHSGAAIATNPHVALLYRDSRSRTTLSIRGRAHVDDSAAVRDRVYNLSPMVEQTHDPARKGSALIIDVSEMAGTSPSGPVRVSCN